MATDARLARLDRFAYLLDRSVKIGPVRLGLDSLVGLIPGIGDVLGLAASSYIIGAALAAGAPRSLLARMALNTAVETILGTVPLLGDAFDIFWHANVRNYELYRRWTMAPAPATRRNRTAVALILAAFLILAAVVAYGVFALIAALLAAI